MKLQTLLVLLFIGLLGLVSVKAGTEDSRRMPVVAIKNKLSSSPPPASRLRGTAGAPRERELIWSYYFGGTAEIITAVFDGIIALVRRISESITGSVNFIRELFT